MNEQQAPRILAPSVLSADFSQLKSQIQAAEEGGAGWIHLDIMDGHFVPNITFGPFIVEAIKKCTSLFLDAHLMMTNPEAFIPQFVKAGCNNITVHYEGCTHLDAVITQIQDLGCKAGVSINPATPIEVIEPILEKVDLILIMSVNPGFGGQKFIPYTLSKFAWLHEWSRQTGAELPLLQVDGGVNLQNLPQLLQVGVNVFVAGSAIFGQENITQVCKDAVSIMENFTMPEPEF